MDRPRNSLSAAVLVLLERADEKRASAERARRLAGNIANEHATADLNRHAAELDLEASEIEERACAVAAERTEELTVDALSLVEEARPRIADNYSYRHRRSASGGV